MNAFRKTSREKSEYLKLIAVTFSRQNKVEAREIASQLQISRNQLRHYTFGKSLWSSDKLRDFKTAVRSVVKARNAKL